MYVCICHSVTDKAIAKAVRQGHDTLEAIQQELKVGTCCGRCQPFACQVIAESQESPSNPLDFALAQEIFA
ncbi:MAG: (2Fe-2S)-binding protein [Proteobacteria bacterium]|nr:MAG: (2Fe-2S)-binding protein [Pseudomonadota bacterium]